MCSGLHEFESLWSMDDVVSAHLVFEMEDELVREKARAESDAMRIHDSST